MDNSPITFGTGNKKILIMAQMFPVFPELKFFIQIFEPLLSLASFDLYDPLANLEMVTNWETCKIFWSNKIKPSQYDLLMGFSLGGSFLQQCLEKKAFQQANYVFFSTPVCVQGNLSNKLQHILNQIENDNLEKALVMLDQWVLPEGQMYSAVKQHGIHNNSENIKVRLSRGIKLLLSHDARKNRLLCQGKILELVGELSQLVTRNDVSPAGNLTIIPSAGMRVLQDQNEMCLKLIKKEYFDDKFV